MLGFSDHVSHSIFGRRAVRSKLTGSDNDDYDLMTNLNSDIVKLTCQ